MKKLILSVAVLATAVAANAQMKPAAKAKSIEVNSALFTGAPLSLQPVGLMLKSYSSETSAMRLGINLAYSSVKTNNGKVTGDKKQMFNTSSSMTFGIAPGIEKHMAGTDRISPYMGVELPIAYKTSTDIVESNEGNDVKTTTKKGATGYMSVGLNGLAGVNYYVTKGLYLGAELGVGIKYMKNSDVKETSTTTGYTAPDDVKGGTDLSFMPIINGFVRLGWNF